MSKAIFVYSCAPTRPAGPDDGGFSVNLFEENMLVYTRYAVDGSVIKEWQFAVPPRVIMEYMATVNHARGWVRGMFPCLRVGEHAPRYISRIGIDGFPIFLMEDIQALWEMSIGEDKPIAHYALAGDYVFLISEDGKDGLLLSFYKDMKDIDNFDGVPVCEGQELSFQGDALVIKDSEKTTYYEKTEHEGFNQLFTVTEKDGKKTFTNDLGEPYDEKEAQQFIDKIAQETAKPLTDLLVKWK